MSIGLVLLGWTLLLTTPLAVALSVCMGVGGCGCPISVKMFLMCTASLALMNNPPNSASAAEDITAFNIWATLWMLPLLGGISSLLDRKKWPPTLLLAPGSLR